MLNYHYRLLGRFCLCKFCANTFLRFFRGRVKKKKLVIVQYLQIDIENYVNPYRILR